ncbi:inositol monophosphatase [bacterium]|nr:inositol monophosphatase [bacterium]
MKQLEVAQQAARTGGAVLQKYFRQSFEVHTKRACDFVTTADVEAEHAIADVIRAVFPDDAILGEENYSSDVSAARLWVVDPLDGTTNFAHGIPHFAVSIGYYEAGEAVCGVILNPARDDVYHAVRGQGAFGNGERLCVADHVSLSESLIGVGFYYDRGAMMEATLASIRDLFGQQIHGIRRFGTASLDLAQVASGMFGAFFEYELSPWDFAAGRLFVEEAGGRITTCRGEALPLAKTSVLASNARLHDSVLSIVERNIV